MSKILVVAEQRSGQLDPIGLELLGKARSLGGEVVVALVGAGANGLAASLGDHGADTVLVGEGGAFEGPAPEAAGPALAAWVLEHKPTLVLAGSTSFGRDVAGAIAAALQVGVLQEVHQLSVEGAVVKAERPLFGGNAMAQLEAAASTAVATVLPKAFEKAAAGAGKAGTVMALGGPTGTAKAQIQAFAAAIAGGKIDLGQAETIVVGGRGVGSGENFKGLEELAELLGGAVGASRAVTDAGWRPTNEQIGQTGVTVKPKLYLAFGVSGAVQHWVGMKDAGFIVAVNKDPECPMMKAADLAIVGDLHQVLPAMIAEVKAAKAAAV
jgi:electron transfer flavoprotein alpha subunit